MFSPDMKLVRDYICSNLDKNITIRKQSAKFRKIDTKGSESKIYNAVILDLPVIVKEPRDNEENIRKEYEIGLCLNKLRGYVPNYMYTYSNSTKSIIVERIPGITLAKAIKNNKLNFIQLLSLYFSILLAIETGQKNHKFCHHDLHTNNIILRPIVKPIQYIVLCDQKQYEVTLTDYIPTIIDYGMAIVNDHKTINIQSKLIDNNQANMSIDMYRLLFYCLVNAKNTSYYKELYELTKFFDNFNLPSPDPNIPPNKFIEWIYSKYSSMLSNVKCENRFIFFPLKYHIPSTCFLQAQEEFELLVESNITEHESFMYCAFISFFLFIFLMNVNSDQIRLKKDKMDSHMLENKKQLLDYDRKQLQDYKSIVLPIRSYFFNTTNIILNFTIHGCEKRICNDYMNSLDFYRRILMYNDFLYIIKQLNLQKIDNIYDTFINNYTVSTIYLFFVQYSTMINRAIRWCEILLEI